MLTNSFSKHTRVLGFIFHNQFRQGGQTVWEIWLITHCNNSTHLCVRNWFHLIIWHVNLVVWSLNTEGNPTIHVRLYNGGLRRYSIALPPPTPQPHRKSIAMPLDEAHLLTATVIDKWVPPSSFLTLILASIHNEGTYCCKLWILRC